MRSAPPLALARLLTPALLALSCAGCVGMTPTPAILAALDCSQTIPPSYRQHIKGAPLPDPTAGGLGAALDGQTSRLDQVNQRVDDMAALMDLCAVRAAALVEALKPPRPWWAFWRPSK